MLVVDDDEAMRRLLVAALGRAGFGVTAAGSGSEALDAARRQPPAAVMLNFHLGGPVDGGDVGVALRAMLGDALPLLFCSGDPDVRRVADRLDAAWLPKPFTVRELRAAAADLLSPRPPQ